MSHMDCALVSLPNLAHKAPPDKSIILSLINFYNLHIT
jgi:hypothetical protein